MVTNNTSEGNALAGFAIYDSHYDVIENNTSANNVQDGLRMTVGSANDTVENNTIANNGFYGITLFPGDDTPTEGGNGHPTNNTILQNQIYGNGSGGISLQDADQNGILQNVIYGNSGPAQVHFDQAVGNVFSGNTFIDPATGAVDPGTTFMITGTAATASSATVSNQPALVLSLDQYSTATYTGLFGEALQVGTSSPATLVPNGSTLVLTSSLIGGQAQVTTISLPPATAADLSYSAKSNTIYLITANSFTLSTIKALLPHGAVTLVDPVNAVWELNANLVLENGAILVLHGTAHRRQRQPVAAEERQPGHRQGLRLHHRQLWRHRYQLHQRHVLGRRRRRPRYQLRHRPGLHPRLLLSGRRRRDSL